MVKLLTAGLLAAGADAAAEFFPPSGYRRPFLRSSNNDECCKSITISGAVNTDANGKYEAVVDSNGDPIMVEGYMHYKRTVESCASDDPDCTVGETNGWCHHKDQAWICTADMDACEDPAANCASPMHGAIAIATWQGCIIQQMESTMAWQSSWTWNGPGKAETFQLDNSIKMTCQGNVDECKNDQFNSCPDDSTCVDTDGGYDCECEAGKTCDDFDQCAVNGGGKCPQGSSCLEKSVLDENNLGYTCSCDTGYSHNTTTDSCQNDNECAEEDFKGCVGKPNSVCQDTEGSFDCVCEPGKFTEDADGNCADFNECLNDDDNDCDQYTNTVCVNKKGGYDCDCPDGFTGNKTTCTDIDECSQNPGPCGEHQECTNETPAKVGDAGYTCACKTVGFTTNQDGSCSDIDECADAVDPCKDKTGTVCQNSIGSFTCDCGTGYKYDDGNQQCENIDECGDEFKVNGTSIFCSENSDCKDTEGSYTCVCKSGFMKDSDGNCKDVDECDGLNPDDVCGKQNSTCTNTDGGKECGCIQGMEFDDENAPTKCQPIDYCNPKNVSHTPDCSWVDGNGACENDYELFAGVCRCNSGYQEGVGANGNATCVDVDECETGEGKCEGKNFECKNRAGDYECVCKKGYKPDGDKCVDRDECAEAEAKTPPEKFCTTANTRCINIEGAAGCACEPGYGIHNGKPGCSDKNECTTGKHDCAKKPNSECSNTPGSFTCDCMSGFTDNNGVCENDDDCGGKCTQDNAECKDGVNDYTCVCEDGYAVNGTAVNGNSVGDKEELTCYDVDECATGEVTCDDQINRVCQNDPGMATCVCKDGWTVNATIAVENQTCTIDVDECTTQGTLPHGPCMENAKCTNTAGSFTCACNKGYKFSADETFCNNINECNNGFKCEKPNSKCVDNDGSAGCTCIDGYHEVNQTCMDYNECKDDPCNYDKASCENKDASFTCNCEAGYSFNASALDDDDNDDVCLDVDECGAADGSGATHDCGANEYCVNNKGSFDCLCNVGYADTNANNASLDMLCEDVDECQTLTHDGVNGTCNTAVNETCFNTPGSFTCGCDVGWEKNITNATSGEFECIDMNECNGPNTCTALEKCVDAEGTYTCECKEGYVKEVTNQTTGEYICADENECAKGSHKCHALASCSNTEGSYTCKCPGEYQGDGKECLMCPSKECWVYEAALKRCTPKDECSKLKCEGDGFDISFSPLLFGLKTDQAANWGSKTQPDFNADTGDYAVKTGFGADWGMSYTMDDTSITFSLMISMSGNERVSHMRSEIDTADTLELGNRQIVVNPFGVGMVFQCTYPTLVKLSSVGYTVEDVSISSSLKGQGQWTDAFEMTLNNGNNAEFILGQVLPVSVTWKVNTMTDSLTFYYVDCTVTHGATDIAVIKDGCYAGATGSQPLASTNVQQNMSFKIFKGVNEAATEQTIECSVLICEQGKCNKPQSNDDCPSGEYDNFYEYTFNGQ